MKVAGSEYVEEVFSIKYLLKTIIITRLKNKDKV